VTRHERSTASRQLRALGLQVRNSGSGDGKGFGEPFVDGGDGFFLAWSGRGDYVSEFLRPEGCNVSGGERPTEQGPVGVNEAEESADGYRLVV